MGRLEFQHDRQFVPAAIEILETPSSPTRRALLLTLCGFVVLAVGWSFFGRLDIEAVAKGQIQPMGRVKVIEPLEPGRVMGVMVDDGAVVREGDPLIAMDPIDSRADEKSARQALEVDLGDAARYRAAIDVVAANRLDGDGAPTIAWDEVVSTDLRLRETQALVGDLTQLSSTLKNFDMQKAERQATVSRLDRSLEADETLISTLQQRLEMRQTLEAHGTASKADMLQVLQEYQRAQATLVSDQGQRGEALAALATIDSDKAKAVSQFQAENTNKYEDASNKAVLDSQTYTKARAREKRTTLLSPVGGVVQKLAVTSIGQVVTTGQELMTIVPTDRRLYVAGFLDNIDIGFVRAGQDVQIKLDAFPFTRYGMVKGKVVSVATDAVDEDEAHRMQSNATSLVNSPSLAGGGGQAQKFVFPVTISLDRTQFDVGDHVVPLTAGMSVTAEIKTDNQRIIEYVLSPLTQTTSEALHER